MDNQEVPVAGFSFNKKTILSITGVLVLLVATGLGVYLSQQKQLFKPKAFETKPVSGPETSISLRTNSSSFNVGDEIKVKIDIRSDIDATNLFAAKLRFPQDLLEVKSIGTVDAGSSIKNWVENVFDNQEGTISLVGGVPTPGFSTVPEAAPGKMAEIIFTAKANGVATISFDPDTAIYRNSDNENILSIKREALFKIQLPQPTPSSVGVSMEPTSVKIVSSVNSTQKAFDMTAVVDKANVYLVLPNEFINKISYVYTRGLMGQGEVRPVYLKVEPFTAPGVYKGTGILRNGDNNQQITFPIEVTVSSAAISPTPTPAGIKGDVNGDSKITLVDMSGLLSKWGAEGAEAGLADLNKDGVVNTIDYSTMIKILVENKVIKGTSDLPANLQAPRN